MAVWFITGASSGLGRALCESLLAGGHLVAATALDPADLADLAPPESGRWWAGRLDVTDPGEIRRAVAGTVAAFGRLDVVVSNAGYGLFGAAEEATDEQIARQLATNLVGPIHLARAVLPHLRKQGSGRIIQISSTGGQATMPGMCYYNASKWGVEGFFDALASEVAVFGIGVTIVEPGSFASAWAAAGRDDAPRLAAYAGTPSARIRAAYEAGAVRQPGDVHRIAAEIIASAAREPAPRRLALGSDAYVIMRKALRDRLARLEAQRELAGSTDRPETG